MTILWNSTSLTLTSSTSGATKWNQGFTITSPSTGYTLDVSGTYVKINGYYVRQNGTKVVPTDTITSGGAYTSYTTVLSKRLVMGDTLSLDNSGTKNISFVSNNNSYSSITTGHNYIKYDSTLVYGDAPASITPTLSHVTAGASNPTTLEAGYSATLTYTAEAGYELPASVTVTGATGVWTKSTGTLVLSNATAGTTITFSITATLPQLSAPTNLTASGTEVYFDESANATSYDVYAGNTLIGNTAGTVVYTITPTCTNVTASASNPSYIEAGGTVTLVYTANSGYKCSSTAPTVTGATVTSWTVTTTSTTDDTGTLVLSNPTGNVSFTVEGEAQQSYPVKGQLITMNLDGTSRQYRVISITGPVAEVVCMETVANVAFNDNISCFVKGTKINLADGTTKNIEDITYDDDLLVWNFDEAKLDSAKPCWITISGLHNNHYYQLTFSDGTILKTTGLNSNHKVYNVTERYFKGVDKTEVGDLIYSKNGIVSVTDKQYIEDDVEYYNLITSKRIDCFAEGILTSDRYGNMYSIDENMQYIDDGRVIRPYSEFEAVGISEYWYNHLRLGEVTETLVKTREYIDKCESQMKPLEEE